MKVLIMAGGKGTRIQSIQDDVPKPMIRILNKPILQYTIECFREQGYTDIVLIIGHLGHVIREYFGDGKDFGVNIEYVVEDHPLGTAGALYLLKDSLKEDFLLVNGDIIFDVNIDKFAAYHKQKGALVTIFTHPNSHPFDSGVIMTDSEGIVTKWLTKEEERGWFQNRVNAGLHMMSPKILDQMKELKKVDLDRDILKPLIEKGQLAAYDSPEYVKDMGTPDRYYSVTEDICNGKVRQRNLHRPQKAVFLDRDGVINKYVGFLRNIDDFELEEDAAQAIRRINDSGYLAIVVTNQPVIARGEVSEEELREIHNKMETLLGEQGAYIDAVYYCPHHPDRGFEGERKELKIDCECRKPKPGMLLKAAEDYHIDLSASWMVGDSSSDMRAGKAAGCRTIFVGSEENECCAADLQEAVDLILKNGSASV